MHDKGAYMDLLTLAGVVLGGAAIVFGFALEGGHFSMLFQFEALVIVLGGTLGAVMIQNTWARFFDAVKQLRLAFVSAREVDRKNLSDLLEWGDRAKLDGLLAFESMDVSGIHPFARRGLELLANGVSTAVLEDALQRELDAYERSRLAAARVWQQAGGYAPTFGILGSVLGLVQVTSHILEPAQLGPGIAVAFIATLYGLAFANLVFLPLYGKLRAQIDSELRFRKLYLDGLLAISRKESPHTIETRLTGDVRGRAAESLA
ncbi:flagellar motor protein MotA [Burkholderia aenigmatica]|uniref:Flagellar motor protein MotA n=4 Tax=Pseudomonadota TaxID=1224 RepID=A0A6J5J025_9BURK|nr:flagellar motor protein MotA [Burkholderia aenigmatica]